MEDTILGKNKGQLGARINAHRDDLRQKRFLHLRQDMTPPPNFRSHVNLVLNNRICYRRRRLELNLCGRGIR